MRQSIRVALLALAWPGPSWAQTGAATASRPNWSEFDKAFGRKPGPDETPNAAGQPEAMPTPNGSRGKITYALSKVDDASPELAAHYARITEAMDKAIWYYENYTTNLRGKRQVQYGAGTATADANFGGPIRFGGSCNVRVAMHEMAHTFGVGTSWQWQKLMQDGVFTGRHATAQMRAITGDPKSVVHGDRQHFWPYGLNYDSEVQSNDDLIRHCLMVAAIRKDLDEVH